MLNWCKVDDEAYVIDALRTKRGQRAGVVAPTHTLARGEHDEQRPRGEVLELLH